jgi:hypothetical protein
MKARVVALMVLGTAGGLLLPGCGGYRDPTTGEQARYGFETLKSRLDLPIETVYAAAQKAAVDLHLKVARSAQDGISAEIRAIDARYDSVEIRLGALPEDRTQLCITVGPFGDRNKSIVLFERVMENLSQAQQVAAAPAVEWENGSAARARGAGR